MRHRQVNILLLSFIATSHFVAVVFAFSPIDITSSTSKLHAQRRNAPSYPAQSSSSSLFNAAPTTTTTTTNEETEVASFIDQELRGAAMKLHTRAQSPKEGEAVEKQKPKQQERYVPTHLDYLKFLVDSQFVYQTFEEVLKLETELKPFVDTGLERGDRLEQDIEFMTKEYDLERPAVGEKGSKYGEVILNIANKGKDGIPALMCHYYNYYFAHTAGGRMIGKQMASLLLDKQTLEFYKVTRR